MARCLLFLGGLLFVPASASSGTASYDDELCEPLDDENPDAPVCELRYAVVDESSGTLTIDGWLCDELTLSAGTAGSNMEPLTVLSADATTIVADWPPGLDAGAVLTMYALVAGKASRRLWAFAFCAGGSLLAAMCFPGVSQHGF